MTQFLWDRSGIIVDAPIRAPFDCEANKAATMVAFEDPQVGDRFTEMYSFWVYVVAVEYDELNGERCDWVVTLEASGPCTFPRDGKLVVQSANGFRARWAYGSMPGYSIRLVDRGNDVRGWMMDKLFFDGRYAKESTK